MAFPLLNAENISKSFGARVLFKNLSLPLFPGDRVGLIGPNGAGKSTLLKILAGCDQSDEGRLSKKTGLHTSYVPQQAAYPANKTVEEFIVDRLKEESHLDDHERHTEARIILGKLGFSNFEQPILELSGGWKKRLDIAKALASKPDILFLDEPTNHLDLESILWLENFLKNSNYTYLLTSHDRTFLEHTCNRIIELNSCYPQGIFLSEGNYSTFLEKRTQYLEGQLQTQQSLASKVRREIEWLRQTPQARTTKSRSRIKEAGKLQEELAQVKQRNLSKQVQIGFDETGRQTRDLVKAKNISKSLSDKLLFSKIDLALQPGMRVAIAGGNGTGKTTLLKILAGELKPDTGTVKYANDLKIVYFEQLREQLPNHISIKEALTPEGGDTVTYRGKSVHVNSWGKRFLFTPERLSMPLSHVSGGEKARILIARFMTKPADILFLDEPSNDLDIETLEVLEESLEEFPGAVVFITHDRMMLDNLATTVLGVGASGEDYLFADYDQWERYLQTHKKRPTATVKEPEQKVQNVKASSPLKLSYKEKRELEEMGARIEKLETDMQAVEGEISKTTGASLPPLYIKLKDLQEQLEAAYLRWQELENKT